MKVLVIERDDATQEAVKDLLQIEWPHLSILKAQNGEQGLLLAKIQHPDLILLEGNMHSVGGLNGIETARTLRRMPETQSVPMIALTTPVSQDNGIASGLSATCDAWLIKPFSAERLYQVVSPFVRLVA